MFMQKRKGWGIFTLLQCTICCKAGVEGKWAKGLSTRAKVGMGAEHQRSNKHQAALAHPNNNPKPGPIVQALGRQAASNRLGISQVKLENHIAAALLVGMMCRPLSFYCDLVAYGRFLASSNRVNDLTSTTGYDNRNWVVAFMSLISEYTLEKQLARIRASPPGFSVQVDETTSTTTDSEMMIHIMYQDAATFEARREFLTMVKCNASTGVALKNTVATTLAGDFSLDLKQVVSFLYITCPPAFSNCIATT